MRWVRLFPVPVAMSASAHNVAKADLAGLCVPDARSDQQGMIKPATIGKPDVQRAWPVGRRRLVVGEMAGLYTRNGGSSETLCRPAARAAISILARSLLV